MATKRLIKSSTRKPPKGKSATKKSLTQRRVDDGAKGVHLAGILTAGREQRVKEPEPFGVYPARGPSRGPNFYEKVYAVVERIPTGKVTSYGAIAETLGMKRSSRMVGHALNAIGEGTTIPAHRVINRIGALSGAHHFGGYTNMRKMLLREGVRFKGELVNMQLHFWDPRHD